MESRTTALRAIEESRVRVRGVPEPKAATLVDDDTPVTILQPPSSYVSRGGTKLAGAMEVLPIPVRGQRALDAGASTGGFTDYLLQEGAAQVTALDVGYGQLHWRLREDPRVVVRERTNLRLLGAGDLGEPFDLVVADLSFISLTSVAQVLAALGHADTDYLLLVKPQFEVGRKEVGKGGVVRRPEARSQALQRVVAALERAGLGARAMVASPIAGAKGNREFFIWAKPGERTLQESRLWEAS